MTKKKRSNLLLLQGLKQCCRCHEVKDLDDFNTDNARADHKSGHCRLCAKEERDKRMEEAEYRRKNAERAIAWDRAHPEERRRYDRAYIAAWRLEKKIDADAILWLAVTEEK
jgi:hypothetical protein